jgi:CHAD domain-containing protein
MKRKYLEEVINKHGHRIKKYGSQLPGYFEAEAIHELRVEYKKLRAFVRMVQMDADASHQLLISPPLKGIYHAAGAVRDLQLFMPQVTMLAAKENVPLPTYSQQLEQRLFKSKEALVKAIEEADIDKELHKMMKGLPKELEDAAIRKFLHYKIAAIQLTLLALAKDKELHGIRKQLKDIMYNIRIYDSDWGISFPIIAWRSETRLNDTATALGDFNDHCLALSFLRGENIEGLPEQEKEVIKKWTAEKLQEKETLKQQVMERVHHLHLVSNFEQLN